MHNELIEIINKELNRRNISMREAAEQIQIDPSTLSRLLSGKTRPCLDTCGKIADWLQLPVERVLALAGYKEDQSFTERDLLDLERIREAWPKLTEREKEGIRRLIRGLVETSEDSSLRRE